MDIRDGSIAFRNILISGLLWIPDTAAIPSQAPVSHPESSDLPVGRVRFGRLLGLSIGSALGLVARKSHREATIQRISASTSLAVSAQAYGLTILHPLGHYPNL